MSLSVVAITFWRFSGVGSRITEQEGASQDLRVFSVTVCAASIYQVSGQRWLNG